MGFLLSIWQFFRMLGLALVEGFLLPVHLLQWLLKPLGPDVLGFIGLTPGALHPQIAIVLAIVCWCVLVVALVVTWQRAALRLKAMRQASETLLFRIRMRSRFQSGWLYRFLQRFSKPNEDERGAIEINLDPEAVDVLRAASDQGSLSAKELAGFLGIPTSRAHQHIDNLQRLDLIDAVSELQKGASHYRVSGPGTVLLNIWGSSPTV